MSRILIAEDEPRIAAFLEKGLRSSGFTTVVATDGDEVVLMATSNNFDLLLLDLGLPVKDGWTVLEELRSQGSQLPIIILTARDDVNAKVAGLERGADDYVTKPFNFKELLARVRLRLRPSQLPRVQENQLRVQENQPLELPEKPSPMVQEKKDRAKLNTEGGGKTVVHAKQIKYTLCDKERLIKGGVILNYPTKTYSNFSLKIFGLDSVTSQSGVFWWGDTREIVIEFNLKYAEGKKSESLQGTLKLLDKTWKEEKGRWIASVRSSGQEVARAQGIWFWDNTPLSP
ncbi:MAG: response regulator transcription factor [Symploca sp. SIO2C1]|nr:response regulator transcription factor [Symploca sp. SIO2C1]